MEQSIYNVTNKVGKFISNIMLEGISLSNFYGISDIIEGSELLADGKLGGIVFQINGFLDFTSKIAYIIGRMKDRKYIPSSKEDFVVFFIKKKITKRYKK